MTMLGTTEQGCLLFADISGYTKYIGDTEITHAQDVIADLIETIVGVITPTFQISRIEGDAAFAYARTGSVTPELLMDTVDSTYFAFRKRLRDIAHATSCPCEACIRIPTLDLKFFLHEGEYAVRQVAGFTELSGIDVILLHRLTKGSAASVVGGHAYAVYTGAMVSAMGFDPASIGLVPHSEDTDDLGEIEVFVQDLEDRWVIEKNATEVLVSADAAVYQASFETTASPQAAWHHATDHAERVHWQPDVTEVIGQSNGRQQSGSVNHCMHGEDVTIEHIVDWRPFTHLTLSYDMAGVEGWLWTMRFDRIDGGTRVTLLVDHPGKDTWNQLQDRFSQHANLMMSNLAAVIEKSHAPSPSQA